jgi:hypothetical protein
MKITEEKTNELSADALEKTGAYFKSASEVADELVLTSERADAFGDLLVNCANTIRDLNTKVKTLRLDLDITSEALRKNDMKLSDSDRDVLKGLGIDLEDEDGN